MKKHLATHLIVRLGIAIASSFACSELQADISESLHRHQLLKEWEQGQTGKEDRTSLGDIHSLNAQHTFFPVGADTPKPKQIKSAATTRTETIDDAVQAFNTALNEALSHDRPDSLSTPADVAPFPSDNSEEIQQEKLVHSFPSSYAAPITQETKPVAEESRFNRLIAQSGHVQPIAVENKNTEARGNENEQPILIRFNNVSIIEYLRFLSGISHKNFIFDENDLQFNITMISEEPTSVEDFMTALLQELRIHDLTLLEQGNNLVIHKNPKVNSVSAVVTDDTSEKKTQSEIVTRVFRLNTADAEKVASIVQPLISERALVEVLKDTNHLVLTDLIANVTEITKLIQSLDSPKSGLVIGQYVVRSSSIDSVLPIVQQLMSPISTDQPIQYVPFTPSNSIFIVSTPFLVERALSILEHLDRNQKSTKIFNLKDLQYGGLLPDQIKEKPLPPPGLFVDDATFEPTPEPAQPPQGATLPGSPLQGWHADNQGNWTFKVVSQPGQNINSNRPPKGKWTIDHKGNWLFVPGGVPSEEEGKKQPKGTWELDAAGNWDFNLAKGEAIGIHVISRAAPEREELLPGTKPKGQFFLHKVQYRKGDEVQGSLQSMADSLRETENVDPDLINALLSAQWLESSNSIVFSGTTEALEKIAILVKEIDIPLRQVFIEMLILETSLVDALNYSVKWGNRFGGGNWAGGDGFDSTFPSPLSAALNTTGVNNLGQPIQIDTTTGLPILGQVFVPNPTPFNGTPGFDMGIIGQRIFNKLTGIEFESIAAFINCLRSITTSNIILNPKIITEDGVPAEVFVGENIAYQTQSIVNDQGVILTSNFEYRDVGTRLKVTPYLGDSNIIALEIENEITNVISNAQAGLPANSNVGPNTSKSSTVTRVHIPDSFFLVISGMLRDETRRSDAHAPCLGGIPILGAAFKDKKYEDQKRNLMIFIQPKIIDTEEQMQCLTKHQQDIMKVKNRRKKDMLYETEEFMDFINMKKYEHERTSIEFEDDEEPL